MKTAIVIPVHNRREVTLRCLAALHEQAIPAWATLIVIDDGSTDGSSEAIGAAYPEVVLLPGDGQLWWTGAVALGMTYALADGATLIFWLNDDCIPRPGTLECLASHAERRRGVAVAQAFTPSGMRYGAYLRTAAGLRPIFAKPGEVRACHTFGGNCVCFPREWVEQAGLPDAQHFPQVLGDSDYGFRLSQRGCPVEVLGDAICHNDDNSAITSRSWLLSAEPMGKILAGFFHRKSNLYVPAYFHYQWRHWGWVGMLLFPIPYLRFFFYWALRALLPRRWLVAVAGPRSAAWRRESFTDR